MCVQLGSSTIQLIQAKCVYVVYIGRGESLVKIKLESPTISFVLGSFQNDEWLHLINFQEQCSATLRCQAGVGIIIDKTERRLAVSAGKRSQSIAQSLFK